MAEDAAVVADSAPVEQAAPPTGEAAVSGDVTHGDAAEQATTHPDDGTAPDDTLDDDSEDGSDEGLTDEEVKTKAEKRRERRQKREQERIDQAVEERLTARERERETKAAADKAEADARAAHESWQQEFGSFVGTPDARQSLQAEINAQIKAVREMDPESVTIEDLRAAQSALTEKQNALARLDANAEVYQKLDQFQFQMTQREYASRAASLPPAHRAKMLASTTVAEALTHLEAGIRADEQAKAKAAADKLVSEWSSRFEKEVAAHAATRTGAPGAGPAPNGSNGSGGGGGALTYEGYQRMSYEDRQKLRATPEGRAKIDAMTRNRATAG